MVIPLGIVAAATLLAGLFVVRDIESVAQLRRRIHEENQLRMRSGLEHVQEYFDAVYSTLLFISLDDDVSRLQSDSRKYIQRIYDYQWEHHRLAEVYVVERGFTGAQPPFLAFEHAAQDHSVEETHSLGREQEEYATQIAQLQEYAANPGLSALLSREIRLCVPDERGGRAKGFVYSVPVRSDPELAGLVAGMIQTETVRGILRYGGAEQSAWLISEHGQLLGSDEAETGVVPWFRAKFGEAGVAGFFAQAGESFAVQDWIALWSPARIVSGERWWFVLLYPRDAHASRMTLGASLGRSVLAGSMVFSGIALGLLVRSMAGRLEEQARHLRERQQLERQVQAVSESEQRRIGTRLHEDLCQRLNGIKAACTVLHKRLGRLELPESEVAVEIAGEIQESLVQARRMADELQPVSMLELGLLAALDQLAASTGRDHGLACRLEAPGSPEVPDIQVATHLYRIAQEAVRNALRHARATQLVIALSATREGIELVVTDNGAGLSPGALRGAGMGLRIAQYRSDLIGAEFSVEAAPEGGTRVRCFHPLPESHANRASTSLEAPPQRDERPARRETGRSRQER